MKLNKKAIIISVIAVVVCAAVIFSLVLTSKVRLGVDAKGEFYYGYNSDDILIATNLSDEKSAIIAQMFNKEKYITGKTPDVEFNAENYLSFADGNKTKLFYIACDGSPYIKYNDKIFQLEDWEIDQLHSILGEFGAFFPCFID